jgi:hypothetical protein
MKHILIYLCLLLTIQPLQAGWFFADPPAPPDHSPEYRARIATLENQMSEQHQTMNRWEIASGILAVSGVLLFVIGTALGAKTRQNYDVTRKLERTIPATPRTHPEQHLGETDAADCHPKMAA